MLWTMTMAALLGQCPNAKTQVVYITIVKADERKNLAETAIAAGSFKTLVAAAKAAGLVEALTGHDELTVFAPTDDAFAKLPAGTVEALLKPENKSKLQRILKYHIVKGAVPSSAVKSGSVKTLSGDDVRTKVDGHGVMVNKSRVVKADVHASNGVIHVIDSVLLPPDAASAKNIVETAKAAGKFNTLIKALEATKLDAALADAHGNFTVFAPTDDAFAKLGDATIQALVSDPEKLAGILKYHVIAGKRVAAKDFVAAGSAKTLQGGRVTAKIVDGRLQINDAKAVMTDVKASNGVIHAIDSVLLP